MSPALHLAEQLISRASVTATDGGCQGIITRRLEVLGFVCESLPFGPPEWRVSNLWAKRTGSVRGPGPGRLVEFGPPNATIHQIDEHIRRDDIETLKNIYRRVLENLQSAEPA